MHTTKYNIVQGLFSAAYGKRIWGERQQRQFISALFSEAFLAFSNFFSVDSHFFLRKVHQQVQDGADSTHEGGEAKEKEFNNVFARLGHLRTASVAGTSKRNA